jgi:hypothetical protein
MLECVFNCALTYARRWVILDNEHWYDRVPKSVETSHEVKVTILWNQQVQSDTTIPSNKPDIVRSMCVNRCCNFRRQKCDQERS